MKDKRTELYERIEVLEKRRWGYLEADDTKNARRIQKQIEDVELKIEVMKMEKITKELNVYIQIVNKYPSVKQEVANELLEKGIERTSLYDYSI
ncbi:MAG: hypothetical protein HFJ52_08895 [Clostridia bacterium]|jgi:NADH/NAD ratio-sensing transcriptional regulator Rex|nr:hypothetical protein [Clostridia bacterium]